jgi:hypothetical protein
MLTPFDRRSAAIADALERRVNARRPGRPFGRPEPADAPAGRGTGEHPANVLCGVASVHF